MQVASFVNPLVEVASLFVTDATLIAFAALVYAAVKLSRRSLPIKAQTKCACEVDLVPIAPPTKVKRMSAPDSDIHRLAGKIRSCAQNGDFSGVVAAFAICQADASISSKTLLHNCFLEACVQCGKLEEATVHFAEMTKLSLVDQIGLNTIIKVHLAQRRPAAARATITEWKSRGLQANCVTYGELLDATVSSNSLQEAWSLLREMQELGIRVNSVICSIMLKSLSAQSRPWEVKKVFALIEDIDDAVDEVLFCSVIDACFRVQQLDALSYFMGKYGGVFLASKLSTPSYGLIIKAYGKIGDISAAWNYWQSMTEKSVTPNALTLGCMVEALVSNNKVDQAWALVKKRIGCPNWREYVNTVICSTVLKGFAAKQQITQVFSVHDEMLRNAIPCNTITLNLMLDVCAKCDAMDRVADLLEVMKQQRVDLDIISYSTILKGYCNSGDLDRAFRILEDMQTGTTFVPDEILYNSLLDGCAKQHRVPEALRIFDDMKAAGIRPSNFTICILVKLLGQERRLDEAFEVMRSLSREFRLRPNVQVYTSLMQACFHSRQVDRALDLHDEILLEGTCKLDERFYAALARGCMNARELHKAADVVRAAYHLPGGRLVLPKLEKIVGVDEQTMERLAMRLRSAGAAGQQQCTSLAADLWQHRGLRLC